MARPKKIIDETQLQKLSAFNCSVEEIADFFDVNKSTVHRRYALVLKKGRSQGKISLKRRMWEVAMSNSKGAVTMLIWLSKQMLGYTDKIDQDIKSEHEINITYDTQFGSNKSSNIEVIQSSPHAIEGPRIN